MRASSHRSRSSTSIAARSADHTPAHRADMAGEAAQRVSAHIKRLTIAAKSFEVYRSQAEIDSRDELIGVTMATRKLWSRDPVGTRFATKVT